jgi:hypothetical protein
MSLLKPSNNSTAFAKIGIYGQAGSGKTTTASLLAIGLTKLVKGTKVAFLDTEKGSDFVEVRFKKENIRLDVLKSRSFKDACGVIREAEKEGYSALIIDSVSHLWLEIQTSYLNRLGRKRLQIQDWGALKTEWQQLTDLYVNSKVHIIMNGRAGAEYETEENSETGKKEMVKVGTKMRAESSLQYEPDLLVEMLSIRKSEISGDKESKGFVNRAVVLKDRSDTINGKEFDVPTFEHFKPFVNFLNIGGTHIGVDTTRNSEDLFEDNDRSYIQKQKRKDIALEELQSVLIKAGLDGTSTDAKKKRVELMEKVFGTHSKTAIEGMSPEALELGLKKISGLALGEQVNVTPS